MPARIKRQHLLELSEVPCCLLKAIVLPWRAGEPELGGLSRAQNQKGKAACPNLLGSCRVLGAALVGSISQPCHGAPRSSLSLCASPCQAPQGEMSTGWHSARRSLRARLGPSSELSVGFCSTDVCPGCPPSPKAFRGAFGRGREQEPLPGGGNR